jgi:hypothetical protein
MLKVHAAEGNKELEMKKYRISEFYKKPETYCPISNLKYK